MTAQTSSPSSKRPITAHPHFPTGIGVWFAVLFSLSSLAIRGSLLEALVVATHIDYLFPAASPPLGAIPRMIIAGLIAWAGYSVGRKVGLRIADAEAHGEHWVAEPPPMQQYGPPDDSAPRRPFQVNEAVDGYYPAAGAGAGAGHSDMGPGNMGYSNFGQGDIGHGAYTGSAYPGSVDPAMSGPPAWGQDVSGQQPAAYAEPAGGHYAAQHAGGYQPAYGAQYAPEHFSPEAYQQDPYQQPAYPQGQQPYEAVQPFEPVQNAYAAQHSDAAYAGSWQPPYQAGHEPQAHGGIMPQQQGIAPLGQQAAEHWPAAHWPPAPAYGDPFGATGHPGQFEAAPEQARQPQHVDAGHWPQNEGVFDAHSGAPAAQWIEAGNRPALVPDAAGAEHAPVADAAPAQIAPSAAERIAGVTLEALSNVELMERLAIAMHRRETGLPANNNASSLGAEPTPAAIGLGAAADGAADDRLELPTARSALAALRGLK